jgi:peptide chain release factor 1
MNNLQNEITRIDQEIKRHQEFLKDPELADLAKEEIDKLNTQKKALEQSLPDKKSHKSSFSTTKKSSPDQANAIVEIRAAAGGDEAKIWSSDLLRMYLRFAESNGFKVSQIDETNLKISGKGVFGLLKTESGVHRVQRVPKTEKQGRIHTSTASVAVLPEIPESQIKINPDDLEWQFTRAGGPGGQYVNKAATAVRLTHKPTSIVIAVRQERIQQQNKSIALELLRSKLWQLEEEKKLQTLDSQRKSAVGRGMRSEKIRTYNFPQNRVTDHRINKSWHDLENILNGNLSPIITSLE